MRESASRRIGESASLRAANDLERLELREAETLRERGDLRVVEHQKIFDGGCGFGDRSRRPAR